MKILLVSLAGPPKLGPESLQVTKVLTEILKRDVHVHWLTENTGEYLEEQEKLSIQRLDCHESLLMRILQRVRLASPFPDGKKRFYEQMDSNFIKSLNDFDVIYSRSFPLSSTVAAYRISHRLNKPWILHLSDPWFDNAFNEASAIDEQWEATCFGQASKISLTNERAVEFYQDKYPLLKEKFVCFTNVYDTTVSDVQDQEPSPYDFNIVHTGNLYTIRNPQTFIDGYGQFLAELTTSERERVMCYFVGSHDNEVKEKFDNFQFHKNLKITGSVPYNKAISYQLMADLLLVIDGKFEDPRKSLFFPSKLLDYMHRRIPVLGITNENSPTWEFLSKGYGRPVQHGDPDKVALALKEAYRDGSKFNPPAPDISYSVEYNVDKLMNWIHAITH